MFNSAFFWPNSPRTFLCIESRIHSGEQWEEAPTSPSDIQQVTTMFQISQGLHLSVSLQSIVLSCFPEDL